MQAQKMVAKLMCVGMWFQLFGHRIVATFMKRGAAGDAFSAHPAPFEHAEAFDGFVGVVRTGGGVDAVVSQHGGEKMLIEPDEFKKEPGHRLGFDPGFLAGPPEPKARCWPPESLERWHRQWAVGQ